jgi:hypothetical protein
MMVAQKATQGGGSRQWRVVQWQHWTTQQGAARRADNGKGRHGGGQHDGDNYSKGAHGEMTKARDCMVARGRTAVTMAAQTVARGERRRHCSRSTLLAAKWDQRGDQGCRRSAPVVTPQWTWPRRLPRRLHHTVVIVWRAHIRRWHRIRQLTVRRARRQRTTRSEHAV